jgi:aspartyl/glutamyl-tRNA(Asn/Gln) amidotransferase C subunit
MLNNLRHSVDCKYSLLFLVLFCYTLFMNIKDVENLAELARIKLTEEEKRELLSGMDSILDYVKQIEKIKVEDAQISHNSINIWREDLPESGDSSQASKFSKKLIVEQFPDEESGFLKVKKIL